MTDNDTLKTTDSQPDADQLMDAATGGGPDFLVPLQRVPADKMPFETDPVTDPVTGEVLHEKRTHYLQKGRSIWLVPTMAFGAMFSTAGLLLSAQDNDNVRMIMSMGELCKRLSDVIGKWDIIDAAGRPLPAPYKNPEAVMSLDERGITWLIEMITDREPAETRGKDSPPSPSTTTALVPPLQK